MIANFDRSMADNKHVKMFFFKKLILNIEGFISVLPQNAGSSTRLKSLNKAPLEGKTLS